MAATNRSIKGLPGPKLALPARQSAEQAPTRATPVYIWLGLMLAVAGTFVAFEALDPDPSLLLSACVAANVGIFLFVMYRLYQWNLLLSPVCLFAVGPAMFMYYSIGNLGARLAGPWRNAGNPGSLDYYPEAALLSTLGLVLFCWVVFSLLPRQFRYQPYRYQDLRWRPWQAVASAIVASAVMIYLSLKFEFVGGYFRGPEYDIDRWLASTYLFFITLSVVVGVSVTVNGRGQLNRLVGTVSVALPMVAALATRSRTFMLVLIITAALCWITLRPRQVRFVFVAAGLAAMVLYALGTLVKVENIAGHVNSMSDNLGVVFDAIASGDYRTIADANLAASGVDAGYRLAGLEYPAALLFAMDHGTAPMYGQGVIGGVIQSLPGFLRPDWLDRRLAATSEREAISLHFVGRGLLYDDSIGMPLVSGLADWGVAFSPLIYAVMALYCLAVWRVAQSSPRLFVAYLLIWTRVDPPDLMWDDGLFSVRALAFVWLVLFLLGPALMPKWRSPAAEAAAPPAVAVPARRGAAA